jgi:ferredoxin
MSDMSHATATSRTTGRATGRAICGLVIAALVLMAAHSLRHGDVGLCAGLVALAGLCFGRSAWLRPVLTVTLGYGVWMWLHTAQTLVAMRQGLSEPWLRLAVILGAVTAITALGFVLLQTRSARNFWHRDAELAWYKAGLFLLPVGLLALARHMTSFPILLSDRFAPGSGMAQVFAHGLYAVWLGKLVLTPKGHRRARPWFWGAFSAVFFGQLALGLAGIPDLLMTGKLHLPVPALILGGPLYRGHGLFMPILYLSTLAFVGPAWCSHLCYIGAWDDVASRLTKGKPRSAGKWLWLGRGLTLGLTIVLALGFRWLGVGWEVAVTAAAVFGLGGVAVMALISARRGSMVHCTAYCPIGLVGNLLGRLVPWRMAIAQGCNQCGKCTRACRFGALEPHHLARGKPGLSCTLCGDCVASCKDSRLHYRFPGLSPDTARQVFLVLIIGLHAAFLAVARI